MINTKMDNKFNRVSKNAERMELFLSTDANSYRKCVSSVYFQKFSIFNFNVNNKYIDIPHSIHGSFYLYVLS